jgi:WD40 repeat protein
MRGHTGNVLSIAWMQDNRHAVSSSVDGTIRKWDPQLGTEVQSTNLQVRTDSVEIGPDGVVYAGDDRGRIAIIDDGVP